MIYFDAAATSLTKPPEVAEGVAWAMANLGNPGRSAAPPAMDAARAVYRAREALAEWVGLRDASRVAFTSGCTESLGLLCRTLGPGDHAIATEMDHNSVLRPLAMSGCQLDILPCDARGVLLADALPRLIRPNTRFVFASHGSNVTGNLVDPAPLRSICRAAGALLVLDVAQTIGCADVSIDMADILFFSGHKALFGPMGVGGLIAREGVELPVLKTGGTGSDSFAPLQRAEMPDLAEAGTPNVPGIVGLMKGVAFIESVGLPAIIAHGRALTQRFVQGISAIDGLRVAGDFSRWPRVPVVSFEAAGMDSAELSLRLWERHGIATRAGGHCAPLLHRRLGSAESGLVRCSFSWFNTLDEIERGIEAVREAIHG